MAPLTPGFAKFLNYPVAPNHWNLQCLQAGNIFSIFFFSFFLSFFLFSFSFFFFLSFFLSLKSNDFENKVLRVTEENNIGTFFLHFHFLYFLIIFYEWEAIKKNILIDLTDLIPREKSRVYELETHFRLTAYLNSLSFLFSDVTTRSAYTLIGVKYTIPSEIGGMRKNMLCTE